MESWVATPAFFNPYPTSASASAACALAGRLCAWARPWLLAAVQPRLQPSQAIHACLTRTNPSCWPCPHSLNAEVYPESTAAPYTAFKGVSAPPGASGLGTMHALCRQEGLRKVQWRRVAWCRALTSPPPSLPPHPTPVPAVARVPTVCEPAAQPAAPAAPAAARAAQPPQPRQLGVYRGAAVAGAGGRQLHRHAGGAHPGGQGGSAAGLGASTQGARRDERWSGWPSFHAGVSRLTHGARDPMPRCSGLCR